MPASSPSPINQLLFGQRDFAEHEELQAFQNRFLISVALCSVVFDLALIAIYSVTAQGSSFLFTVNTYWGMAAAGNLALWRWLRAYPRKLKTGSFLTAALFWATVCIPGRHLPPDPALSMWLLLLVVASFIMMGRIWGWLSWAIVLASSFWLLENVDLSLYPNMPLTVVCTTLGSAILGHIYVERFNYFFTRMGHHQQQLLHLSTFDHLTGALNAGSYYAQCNAQLAICQRLGMPYTVLFVDLDHFKRVNDTYGHATGDHVLQQTAQVLRQCLRESDLMGRVGGEEFSIFMPNTTQEGGYTVAERIRAMVEGQDILFAGKKLNVTSSIGLTWASGRSQEAKAIHVIQQLADKAMYDAKRAGRNRVCCFIAETPAPELA